MAVYYATSQYRVLGRFLQANQIKAWIRNNKYVTKPEEMLRSAIVDDSIRSPKGILGLLPSAASVLTISAPNMLLSASLNSFLIGLGVYVGFIWTRNLDESAGANDSRAVFITYVVSLTVCYGIYALSGVVMRSSYLSEFDFLKDAIKYIEAVQGDHHAKGASEGDGGTSESFTRDLESPALLSASSKAQKRPIGQGGTFQDDSTYLKLVQALRKAAKLRRESAEADELVAQLYEHLGQTQFGGDDKITGSADKGD
jgi:hypothetical protein